MKRTIQSLATLVIVTPATFWLLSHGAHLMAYKIVYGNAHYVLDFGPPCRPWRIKDLLTNISCGKFHYTLSWALAVTIGIYSAVVVAIWPRRSRGQSSLSTSSTS